MTVIGRDKGKFIDNAKYFFLQSVDVLPAAKIVFLTELVEVEQQLARAGYSVVRYPSMRAAWQLLRSSVVVVDSVEWPRNFRRFLVARARKVQLWHGVGFKRIELDKWSHEARPNPLLSSRLALRLRIAMHMFTGRLVRYDAVNVTSIFYRDQVFSRAFRTKQFLVAGYPRNSFGAIKASRNELIWSNVDPAIQKKLDHWNERRKVVLVAPTFRDTRSTPMGLDSSTIAKLDEYCERRGVEFVFKFHPLEQGPTKFEARHLHLCEPGSDLYPILPSASALVTDYSSIYMDFLLLDKPILFLAPDIEQYEREDRQLQFDYSEMTPGPKVKSWGELIEELDRQFIQDDFSAERARLRQLAFDGLRQEDATGALINFMRQSSWLADGGDTNP
jgi:CDP-glycerol glycerophosphotransferase (TagB/SpsB family)